MKHQNKISHSGSTNYNCASLLYNVIVYYVPTRTEVETEGKFLVRGARSWVPGPVRFSTSSVQTALVTVLVYTRDADS